ncbi:MAG TPA: hypothetical protein VIT23_18560 [Terrimicrobiaceae bacterium]
MATTALEKIKAIREKAEKEVEAIKSEAVSELSKRIGEAREHLRGLEAEYTELTGRNVRGERVGRRGGSDGTRTPKADFGSDRELVDLLKGAPNQKMSRRALNEAGYSLASAIAKAKEDPKKFGFEQNKAQGSVWLK